jgi:hypothetical protein
MLQSCRHPRRAGTGFDGVGTDFGSEGTDFGSEGTSFGREGTDFWRMRTDLWIMCTDFLSIGTDFWRVGTCFSQVETGFRAMGTGFRAVGTGFRAVGTGFRAVGTGFRAVGTGFRAMGTWSGRQEKVFPNAGTDFRRLGTGFLRATGVSEDAGRKWTSGETIASVAEGGSIANSSPIACGRSRAGKSRAYSGVWNRFRGGERSKPSRRALAGGLPQTVHQLGRRACLRRRRRATAKGMRILRPISIMAAVVRGLDFMDADVSGQGSFGVLESWW